jgi:hypothetical protein
MGPSGMETKHTDGFFRSMISLVVKEITMSRNRLCFVDFCYMLIDEFFHGVIPYVAAGEQTH